MSGVVCADSITLDAEGLRAIPLASFRAALNFRRDPSGTLTFEMPDGVPDASPQRWLLVVVPDVESQIALFERVLLVTGGIEK